MEKLPFLQAIYLQCRQFLTSSKLSIFGSKHLSWIIEEKCLKSELLYHTVQKLRVINNKCPKTFDSFFSLNGIAAFLMHYLCDQPIRKFKKSWKNTQICIVGPMYSTANILLVKKATFPYLFFPILFQCIKGSENNVKLILEWFLKLPYSMVVSTSIM